MASKKTETQLVDCESCQATGLVLPDGNIKYKTQAKESCQKCKGSGKVEVEVEVETPAPKPKAKPKAKPVKPKEQEAPEESDETEEQVEPTVSVENLDDEPEK